MPLALVVGFPIAAFALGLPLGAAGLHAALGAAGLAAGMAMFAPGWIGGGDAKLLAAAALWLGWPAAVTFLLATAVAGGALALALIGLRSNAARAVMPAGPAWLLRLAEPGEGAPYGVAIAIGALAALPVSDLVAAR
jgi:prepilin peptidase CpaA